MDTDTRAICPRCGDLQFTKKRGGELVFHAHAAKGTSPRMWCRESGQPAPGRELLPGNGRETNNDGGTK